MQCVIVHVQGSTTLLLPRLRTPLDSGCESAKQLSKLVCNAQSVALRRFVGVCIASQGTQPAGVFGPAFQATAY